MNDREINLAHAFAIENQLIQAEMIEAIEFPDLANTFRVSSVPQTTINTGAATRMNWWQALNKPYQIINNH